MSEAAVYPLQPACPKCLRALETPEYWLKVEPSERFGTHTVYCPECKVTVQARFFDGRRDL